MMNAVLGDSLQLHIAVDSSIAINTFCSLLFMVLCDNVYVQRYVILVRKPKHIRFFTNMLLLLKTKRLKNAFVKMLAQVK